MSLFSERVKWLREKRGLTQKDVAERIGMSQQGYSNIENGRREPNLATLFRLRQVLDESLDFIVGYTLEDIRAETLYELYVEARRRREECEEDIDYLKELMADEGQRDAEKDFERMKAYREELKLCKEKEDRAFKNFFEYALTVPGFVEEYSKKEYWIERYASYLENDKKLYHDFQDELYNL